jgi:fatty-acyl-CoA synthase
VIPEGIGSWVRRRAVKSRDHTALVFRDAETTYSALSARVDALAGALRERGVATGDRVAYLGNNHPSFIESMFATTLLGAIFVPLNTRLSPAELRYQLDDSGARLLVASASLEEVAATATAGLSLERLRVREPDDDATAAPDAVLDYEAVIAGAEPLVDAPRVTLDDRAIIIYTSGTTGRPKGAVLTHGNLTWNALNAITDYDYTSSERTLIISPMFHVASFGMGVLPTFLKGGAVLLQERFVPAEALAAIERLQATFISGVPTTYQFMMEDPAWPTADIRSLRSMTCGGSAISERVIAAYAERGLAFSGGYGMTEASPGVTMMPPWHSVDRIGSSGLAHFFTTFRLRDTESGELVTEPGRRGEIEASGPSVFLEYWGRPEETAAAFTSDGWLRTGDVGFVDADGFLTVVDRVKDVIISGGENIYSAEVEQVVSAAPGVTGVAVIGVPSDRWGEVPHAVVTLAPGATLDLETLLAFCSERLARYKLPKSLEIVDELPRTASGKVRKAELREQHRPTA